MGRAQGTPRPIDRRRVPARPWRAGRLAAVPLAVAVALVSACAPRGGPDPATTPTPGPAEAYVETVLGSSAEEAAAEAARAEEAIAACMAEEGFEYVPDVSRYSFYDARQGDPPAGSRDFAEQFGYGHAVQPEGAVSTSPDDDPNAQVVAAMGPDESEAYHRALFGDYAGPEPPEGALDPDRYGCTGLAIEDAYDDARDPVSTALEEEIARIDAEVAPNDPEVHAAEAEWSACMADAGHPGLASPRDAEQLSRERSQAFNGAIAANPELGRLGPDGRVVGEAELAAQEAALALADWDCRAEVDYDAAWSRARDAAQQEYVDAHRDELDAWVERAAD